MIKGARAITIEAGKNLSYSVRSFKVKAGEPIQLTFVNPDSVPHNWALLKPGTLTNAVGDLVNKIIAEPDAVSRHYIPSTDDVLAYTDIVGPAGSVHDLLPRPSSARPLSLSLHVSRPLDGHERRDDRGLTLLAGDVLSKNRSNFRPQRGRHIRRPRTRHQIQPELGGGAT